MILVVPEDPGPLQAISSPEEPEFSWQERILSQQIEVLSVTGIKPGTGLGISGSSAGLVTNQVSQPIKKLKVAVEAKRSLRADGRNRLSHEKLAKPAGATNVLIQNTWFHLPQGGPRDYTACSTRGRDHLGASAVSE